MTHVQIGKSFNKITDTCTQHFENVSKNIDIVQNRYISRVIDALMASKNDLLMADKDAFSDVKVKLFDVLDAIRDIQIKVESAQYRLKDLAPRINRYISRRPLWYYQDKYSYKGTRDCGRDSAIVDAELSKFKVHYTKFHTML